MALSRLDAGELTRDVEWSTLVFFAGLFDSLMSTGVIDEVARSASEALWLRYL